MMDCSARFVCFVPSPDDPARPIDIDPPKMGCGPPGANPFGLLLEFFNAEYERIVTGTSTAGFGFDVNRSWLLGANDNFYVGSASDSNGSWAPATRHSISKFVPTIRIVNVGFAF